MSMCTATCLCACMSMCVVCMCEYDKGVYSMYVCVSISYIQHTMYRYHEYSLTNTCGYWHAIYAHILMHMLWWYSFTHIQQTNTKTQTYATDSNFWQKWNREYHQTRDAQASTYLCICTHTHICMRACTHPHPDTYTVLLHMRPHSNRCHALAEIRILKIVS